MRFLILIPLVIVSAYEYFMRGQCGLALVSGLYMILSIQAEHAANRFLRYGLYPASAFGGVSSNAPPKPKGWDAEPEETIKVAPLGTRKEKTQETYSRPASEKFETPKQEKPKAAPRPEKKAEPKPEVKAAPKPQAAKPKEAPKRSDAPCFNGKPHEVLVVQENAATITIVRAFRHWVKKYHPDHAHTPAETQSANEHTRLLTAAKEKLLDRRKQMRKSKTA